MRCSDIPARLVLLGHELLDLLDLARHLAQHLAARRRDDHVLLDADAAEAPELLNEVLVEEVSELRVLHGWKEDSVNEVAARLDRQHHAGLQLAAASQVAQARLFAALGLVGIPTHVVHV